MKIPKSSRKKGLIVVDLQSSFLNKRNAYVLKNVLKLLKNVRYDAYVEATFHAEKGSIWDIQQQWICPEGPNTKTVEMISAALKPYHPLQVHKDTKSVFKGDKDVVRFLKKRGVKDVHIVGVDTDDCILATAYEAFDLGFVTYVIEEGVQSSSSDTLHKAALTVLRREKMTNHSSFL